MTIQANLYLLNKDGKHFNYPISKSRQSKIDKCLDKDKEKSKALGYLIQYVFNQDEDSIIQYDQKGKPHLKGESNYISLSHSKDMVALVHANVEVGLDIEYIDDAPLQIAKTYFPQKYVDWIFEKDSNKRFFYIWTRIEAISKHLGRGFESFDCIIDNSLLENWYFETFETDDYMISVTSQNSFKLNISKVN